jgi:hypothetical protein
LHKDPADLDFTIVADDTSDTSDTSDDTAGLEFRNHEAQPPLS